MGNSFKLKNSAHRIVRTRALALLAKGLDEEQTASELRRRYHSEDSVADVRRAYFPPCGPHAISKLVGADREQLLGKLGTMKDHSERSSLAQKNPEVAARRDKQFAELRERLKEDPVHLAKMAEVSSRILKQARKNPVFMARNLEALRRVSQDPEFAARRNRMFKAACERARADPAVAAKIRRAASETLKRLHQDAGFRARLLERGRVRFAELNKDPRFRENRENALQAHYSDYRARKRDALEKPIGWDNHSRVVLDTKTPEHAFLLVQLRDGISRALDTLKEPARTVLAVEFDLEVHPETIRKVESLPLTERQKHLYRAMESLRKDPALESLLAVYAEIP